MAVEGVNLSFLFQDLPTWLRLTIIIIISFFSIVFLEIIFYGIIGHSGGDLGVFGKLHTAIWEWARFVWSEVRDMWDIAGEYAIQGSKVLTLLFGKLYRICGVRELADQGAPGMQLQVLPQASDSPPYMVSHYIFLSCDTNIYEFGPAYHQPT